MTIELTENTIGIWFCKVSETSDFLGSIWKTAGKLHLEYRFRHYVDDKPPFESEDTKNWYAFTGELDEEADMVELIRKTVSMMASANGTEPAEFMMGPGGAEELGKRFAATPFTRALTIQ